MNIDSYSFGKMIIAGATYESDLIIYPDRINPSWRRKEGHRLQLDDLKEVFTVNPEVLIIGTGKLGVMKVSNEVNTEVRRKNIELIVEKSTRAVELFNSIHTQRKTVGAFHLTC